MTDQTVTIAMAQMFVSAGDLTANLQHATQLIATAAHQSAQIVVLPECCDVGWTDDSARELADTVPGGVFYEGLRKAALKHQVCVVAGLTERAVDQRIFNAAVVIDPHGNLIALHRKINVLSIAQHLYCIGDRLTVFPTPWGTMGVNICADNFDCSLAIGDTLCRMGARVILSPCAWADDVVDPANYAYCYQGWQRAYAHLARHYQVTVIGVSNVGDMPTGPWKGKKAVGCSVAVGSDGELLANLRTGWTVDAEEVRLIEVPVISTGTAGTDLPSLFGPPAE